MDIIIKKHNEVYSKILCEPGIAQEISDIFTFEVPGAKFMPSYKNKVWDGKIRLFNVMSCLLYCGLISELEKFCKSRQYKFEYDPPIEKVNFTEEQANSFIDKIKPKHKPRDYQVEAFIHAVKNNRALLLSPTASGKSMMIYLLVRYFKLRTLVIVPTTSLVHQMASDFEDYGLPEGCIHKITSGQEKNTNLPIVISTWQSIFKLPKSWFDQFNLVIGDEAHLFKAKSLTDIMTKLDKCKYRFGFTGTLDGTQTNKLVLEGLFGPVYTVTTTAKLIERKDLASFKIKALVLSYSDDVRKVIAGIDYQSEIDFIVTNEKRNKFIKNLALSLEGNSLILFQYVEKQGKPLFDMIQKEAGERKVFFISGDVEGEEREIIRASIEKEKNCIVVASFGTSSTGINIRNLHNIIFASPSKSRVRNLQSIGRGLRKSETKQSSVLYDIADDLSWKSKKNHTINHFVERIKIYVQEKFEYKIINIDI
jgi:superfamily II DNA or RNA helicase